MKMCYEGDAMVNTGQTLIVATPEELLPLISEALRTVLNEKSFELYEVGDANKKLLTPKDIEKEFGIHRKMLAYWRMEGIGPTYITFGRRIFYDRTEFEGFVTSGKIKTTGYVDR